MTRTGKKGKKKFDWQPQTAISVFSQSICASALYAMCMSVNFWWCFVCAVIWIHDPTVLIRHTGTAGARWHPVYPTLPLMHACTHSRTHKHLTTPAVWWNGLDSVNLPDSHHTHTLWKQCKINYYLLIWRLWNNVEFWTLMWKRWMARCGEETWHQYTLVTVLLSCFSECLR